MRRKITISMESDVIAAAKKKAGLACISRWVEWCIKKELGLPAE